MSTTPTSWIVLREFLCWVDDYPFWKIQHGSHSISQHGARCNKQDSILWGCVSRANPPAEDHTTQVGIGTQGSGAEWLRPHWICFHVSTLRTT
jgi:hypothetical protein